MYFIRKIPAFMPMGQTIFRLNAYGLVTTYSTISHWKDRRYFRDNDTTRGKEMTKALGALLIGIPAAIAYVKLLPIVLLAEPATMKVYFTKLMVVDIGVSIFSALFLCARALAIKCGCYTPPTYIQPFVPQNMNPGPEPTELTGLAFLLAFATGNLPPPTPSPEPDSADEMESQSGNGPSSPLSPSKSKTA